ncbi:MAG: hypothetical protein M1822_004363 [Bathelium mastoideum]|nr:MAG: hypothetical protein M1822_004363 [Bathelium mastoideum]
MLDPFPFPPPTLLQRAIAPFASSLHLSSLPLHIHEVLLAFLLYHLVNTRLSPWLSTTFFPATYAALPRRTRINWDVHVVSMLQSCLINALALAVIWSDDERRALNPAGRVFGYTGAGGLIQAFATGYFLWDLTICARHFDVFGPGLLAHAVSALAVFLLGFRPVFNYYGPVFILYELSTPFLNLHWFFDKTGQTGSTAQLVNGFALIGSFAAARLGWGTYSSLRIYWDVYRVLIRGESVILPPAEAAEARLGSSSSASEAVLGGAADPKAEIVRFADGDLTVPWWVCAAYLGANLTLHSLNFYWFGKMIATVRKRFDPPLGTKGLAEKGEKIKKGEDGYADGAVHVGREARPDGTRSLEIESREVRNRRRG